MEQITYILSENVNPPPLPPRPQKKLVQNIKGLQ